MEAIDNRYLIAIKSDGTIDAVTINEGLTLKDKSKILEFIAEGWTVIIKDSEDILRNRAISENSSILIFPNAFSSFEQASISLELFDYYSNNTENCYNFYDRETSEIKYSLKENTREKLKEEKRRLEERLNKQEYISKKALILIYPDGKVESVKETLNVEDGDKYHLYYYTKLYEISEILRELSTEFIPYIKKDNNFCHNKIDNELVKKRTIVMLNQDIGVKLEKRTHPLSKFSILLPKNYGSVLQTEKIEEILRLYPEHRMSLGKWNDLEERCCSTYLTELEDIGLKKELIRKEGK